MLIAFTILFAVGWVAFFGGWRCYTDPDSAGVFAHSAEGDEPAVPFDEGDEEEEAGGAEEEDDDRPIPFP